MYDILAAKIVNGPPRVRGVLRGVYGRELRGTLFVLAGAPAPVVVVAADGVDAGTATVRPARDVPGARAHEAAWSFRFTLADTLFDGRVHAIRARVEGDPAAFGDAEVAFAGDPAIVLPPLRVRPARDPAMLAVLESLQAQTAVLTELVDGGGVRAGSGRGGAVADLAARYGVHVSEAAAPTGADYIWFGVIDWAFRIQRPQHLAMQLAALHGRVLYVSIVFEPVDARGRFRIVSMVAPGVYEVRLKIGGALPENIYGGFTQHQIDELRLAVDEMCAVLGVRAPATVVQFPSWYPIACAIPGATVVHDCLDLVSGFKETAPAMVELESRLVRDADVAIVSSQPLAEHVLRDRADCVLVRNAADVELFAEVPDRPIPREGRPVIGYIGAISYWYEVGWIELAARTHPEWDFVLIGATDGCDVRGVKALSNVKLLGERPYAELPERLAGMDVTVIPFQLTELIACTNPVKMYEYMAAGKPVVASAMPEVVAATDLVYIARDARDFVAQLERALHEDRPDLRARRRAWALEHTWRDRADRMLGAIADAQPLVSVVVLAYDNWAFTRACVDSVLRFSDYENLEVIVVDNGSKDETVRDLPRLARSDARVRVVRNAENLGFAAGNNAGIAVARGDYVILLNNDTYVTRGWVRDLIRPLALDREIGLAGPLTNNMGNEQKVDVHYGNMSEMAQAAREVARRHVRERFDVHTLAFFCVAMRRDVIERVGLLDETYGVGFFEDDDYCRRVEEAGYRLVVVDDAFVHHHLSASFDALGADRKREQMERNKAIYESRWGEWKPHRYREAPGFG